ncbi:MAG: cysteine hydrolase, partial [Janthinobacterium sp.]
LLAQLRASHQLVIAGEASSHCVRATTEHIVDNWGSDDFSRIVLLTDCMSPVTGFERQQRDFIAGMQERGVRLATSADIVPELQANAPADGAA